MATWRRCEKSSFYRRASYTKRYDKRIEALDKTYVDPVDLIVIHTIPGDDSVAVLKWRVISLDDIGAFELLHPAEIEILLSWAKRVEAEMDGGISRRQKDALLADLDVDLEARDSLLSAVERFVFMSPPEAIDSTQREVPRNTNAVDGLLFHWGVGPC